MNCTEATQLIGRALDAGMAPEGLSALMAHLEGCDACRQDADTQLHVRRVLMDREPEDLPDGFDARLRVRLERPDGWLDLVNWPVWSLRVMAIAAALVIWAVAATQRAPTAPTDDLPTLLVEWGLEESGARDLRRFADDLSPTSPVGPTNRTRPTGRDEGR